MQRFLESPADRHGFTNRFHLCCQTVISGWKLFKCETWNLGHHVVDGGFERGRGRAAGNLVAQLIKRVANGQFRSHLGNGKTGGLGGQRRRSRYPGVHFDNDYPAIVGVHSELDIGTACVNTDLSQHSKRRVAQTLVFLVCQCQRRCNGNRVAGMDAHRVEVFNRTDYDAVIVVIPHHFHFVLFPPQHGDFQQYLGGRRCFEAAFDDIDKLFAVVGDTAAGTPHRKRWPDDGRKTDTGETVQRLIETMRQFGPRGGQANVIHRLAE